MSRPDQPSAPSEDAPGRAPRTPDRREAPGELLDSGLWWVLIVVLGLAAGVIGSTLIWGLDYLIPAESAPTVPGEVIEILELAASRGIFAYDAPSGLTSLPVSALPEATYRLSTTARRAGARPDTLISVGSRDECVRLAEALAELRRAVGFCDPDE